MNLIDLDRSLMLAINGLAHHSYIFDKTMVILITMNFLKGGFWFVFLWWLWFRPSADITRDRAEVFRIVFGLFAALVVARLLQIFLPLRTRPIHDPTLHLVMPYTEPPAALEHWSSFPSDHAVVFFAIGTAVWLHYRWLGAIAYLWVTLFALLPRIYIGFHYPGDVLGGAILGVLVMRLALWVPLPRVADTAIAWAMSWERRRPEIFYCLAVAATFELMMMGNDVRLIARSIPQLL